MALQDLTVRSSTSINRRHGMVEPSTVPVSLTSVDGDVQAALNAAQIRRFLTGIGESDNYHVALVSSTRAGAPGRDSSAHTKIVLLPVTWKDVSALLGEHRVSSSSLTEGDGITFGEVLVDLYRMKVTRYGKNVDLTALEFKVLKFLITNAERAISRDELLNQVWGYNNYPCTRTVDNHILRLRQKLESDPAYPIHFRTVHGVGYRFVP